MIRLKLICQLTSSRRDLSKISLQHSIHSPIRKALPSACSYFNDLPSSEGPTLDVACWQMTCRTNDKAIVDDDDGDNDGGYGDLSF